MVSETRRYVLGGIGTLVAAVLAGYTRPSSKGDPQKKEEEQLRQLIDNWEQKHGSVNSKEIISSKRGNNYLVEYSFKDTDEVKKLKYSTSDGGDLKSVRYKGSEFAPVDQKGSNREGK